MASLLSLQYPTIISHHSPSSSSQSSSSSSATCLIPRSHRNRIHSRKPHFVTRSAVEETSFADSAEAATAASAKATAASAAAFGFSEGSKSEVTASLKIKLLAAAAASAEAAAASAAAFGFGEGSKSEVTASLKIKLLSVVSGLNRGLAASEDDLRKAEAAASELEAIGEPVNLLADTDKLQGRWKLIYSSGFSSRTLGGSRPGPPTGRLLPITLGQVFQRIDTVSRDFDNIVELELGAPWPLPPVELTASLAHKFELIGNSRVKIVFQKTTVKTSGNFSQLPQLEIPRIPDGFRPPSNTGSGQFEVTYLDSDTRITRGDRSELRVFVIS